MTKINEYYKKKQLMAQLQKDLVQMEQDQALKRDLDFQTRLDELMKEYGKSARDALQVLSVIDPSVGAAKSAEASTTGRAKRQMKQWKNPHTGETVETRGGNHKTLNEWRDQYGKDVVRGWQVN
ncbi:MAG: DNA binding protein [Gammaproteobacteria bacterium]|nr:DNA binding protein [Gammaproteobacteria bacterium]